MKINLKISCLMILVSLNAFSDSKVQKLFEDMSSIDKPFELRDPFLAPIMKRAKTEVADGKVETKSYSNIPILGMVNLEEILITGVILGEERRAFLIDRRRPAQVFTIKEGMSLGLNQAEIKAIMPGGIILVEKVVNIYGDTEYLETVVPISR